MTLSRITLILFGFACCLMSAWAAPTVEIKLRDTSYFVGTPFNYYVRVTGVKVAPQPQLYESESLQIRYIGAAPSSRSGEDAFTFTYEAVPLKDGNLTVPGGFITIGGESIEIEPVEISVSSPKTTEEMELAVTLSQEECFVGEPVLVTFTWTTNLSLNGVKAVDIRIPALEDSHFAVRDPAEEVNPNSPNAIGLPVANQRVIAEFSDTQRNGEPAVQLTFQKILVPTQASSLTRLLQPATLLCSYSPPRDAKFKGARYPSYFNNEFFDEDVVGEYERLMIRSKPSTLMIKPLPTEAQPEHFSGIVGALKLRASADPLVAEVSQPVTLMVEASGLPFPHLLGLPPFQEQDALARSFLIPEERSFPEIKDGKAIFVQTIRPERENVSVIPTLEVNYFDPKTETYGVARTEPIPITVSRAAAINAFDAAFSDGTQLKNEIRSLEGGIYHNYLGGDLLVARQPHQPNTLIWTLMILAPPLVFLIIRARSHEWRLTKHDPVTARRRLAFIRFQRALENLGPEPRLDELSNLLRSYLADRFEVAAFASGAAEMRALALAAQVERKEADALANLVAWADAAQFSTKKAKLSKFDKERLMDSVRKLERHAAKAAVFLFAFLFVALDQSKAASEDDAQSLLKESQTLFEQANEAALVDPAKSKEFYRLAAERVESLIHDYGYTNGELYYNLGNTYFLSGDLGAAILNYRRAALYLPSDPRIHSALHYVRTQRVDIYPDNDLAVIWKTIFFWHYHFTPFIRQLLIAACIVGIWTVLTLHLFRPVRSRWSWIASFGVAIVLLLGSNLLHSLRDPQMEGVIVEREIMPRKGDAYVYDPALSNPLHSGTEVRILESRRDWLWVELTDGSKGWVPADTVERIVAVEEEA